MTPSIPLCGICGQSPRRYKCPQCVFPSCSLDCYRQHACHPQTTPSPAQPVPACQDFRHLGTRQQRSLLSSQRISHLLQEYPQLQNLLRQCPNTTQHWSEIYDDWISTEPSFQLFVDALMETIGEL